VRDGHGRPWRNLAASDYGDHGCREISGHGRASDLLAARRVEHAAIDVDALGLAYLSSATTDDAMYANLASVCRNYARLGVQRFLLARALESRLEFERCRDATAAANVVVCRLTADMSTLQERVKQREPGILQAQFVARVEVLNAILDRAELEDFTLANADRSVTDVAREMLMHAGWLSE